MVVRCGVSFHVQVESAYLQDLTAVRRGSSVCSHPDQTSYLLSCFPQTVSYVRDPRLSDHHALWAPKAPEGCVGWQICATHKTAATHVCHLVGVFHVEQSALHDLSTHSQERTSSSRHCLQMVRVSDLASDADRQGEVQGVSCIRVVRHVQSHDLPAAEKTHLERKEAAKPKIFNFLK